MERVRYIRGQSLVEFALTLSLLMLIFFGVFDLGRVFHAYIVITNAAREGAYYGSMHPSDNSGIVARVIGEAQGSGIALSDANVSVSSSGISGTPICVTVSYDFTLLSSFLLGGRTIRLQSCAEMVIY
ncbi:MAG: pilus assembly protein [Chloroflexi bacterium]|nr:pilus assembly protein [Chloroflexota bacterium]